MGWHHHHMRRLKDDNTKRKISSRVLISRLLRYFLPYKKELALVLISIIATSITGIISPYILGQEIVSKYILKSDFAGLQQIILVYIGVLLVNWIANSYRHLGLGKVGQNMLFKMRELICCTGMSM